MLLFTYRAFWPLSVSIFWNCLELVTTKACVICYSQHINEFLMFFFLSWRVQIPGKYFLWVLAYVIDWILLAISQILCIWSLLCLCRHFPDDQVGLLLCINLLYFIEAIFLIILIQWGKTLGWLWRIFMFKVLKIFTFPFNFNLLFIPSIGLFFLFYFFKSLKLFIWSIHFPSIKLFFIFQILWTQNELFYWIARFFLNFRNLFISVSKLILFLKNFARLYDNCILKCFIWTYGNVRFLLFVILSIADEISDHVSKFLLVSKILKPFVLNIFAISTKFRFFLHFFRCKVSPLKPLFNLLFIFNLLFF